MTLHFVPFVEKLFLKMQISKTVFGVVFIEETSDCFQSMSELLARGKAQTYWTAVTMGFGRTDRVFSSLSQVVKAGAGFLCF